MTNARLINEARTVADAFLEARDCQEAYAKRRVPVCDLIHRLADSLDRASRRDSSVAWFGTLLQVVGAIMVASNLVDPFWGYFVMMPGAAIWLIESLFDRRWAQVPMWAIFFVINLVGLWRWSA